MDNPTAAPLAGSVAAVPSAVNSEQTSPPGMDAPALQGPPTAQSGAACPWPDPLSHHQAMVLLVDDQPIVGEMVRRLVADEPDIDFHFCPQALRAVDLAEQIRPTVILQDLVMPDVDGLELVCRFRQHGATAATPIIVLSTREDPQVKSQAFAAGANDYLVKLPDKAELIARIRYHSRAYLNMVQRDAAYRALRESQQKLLESNSRLMVLNQELEEANGLISELARRDPLTGLVNRRVLEDELTREAFRSARSGRSLCIIIMDVDHFKSINDAFGHAGGDEVLRTLGKFLDDHLRPHDVVARYGGEEFVALLADTDTEQGLQAAERIRIGVSELKIPDHPRPITMSLGVAVLPPGQPTTGLIARADTALYRAKANGRNRVESEG